MRPHRVPVIMKRPYLKMMTSALLLACSPSLTSSPYTPYVPLSPPSTVHLLTSPPMIYVYVLTLSLPPLPPSPVSLPLLTNAIHHAGNKELPEAQDGWEYGRARACDAVPLPRKGATWTLGFSLLSMKLSLLSTHTRFHHAGDEIARRHRVGGSMGRV